jgi:hypothetical protein
MIERPAFDADRELDGEDAAGRPPERPVDRFRRGAVGSVVAAGLLGLRDALEGRPEREEVTIVSEAPEGEGGQTLDIHLDPDHPEQSIAVLRPAAPRPDRPAPGDAAST